MSVAGVTESYDTSMADFDISMQSGISTSDLWASYPPETVMDDDDRDLTQGHSTEYEGVEVDMMHGNDTLDFEYDMLDNDTAPPVEDDVELQDAAPLAETMPPNVSTPSFLQHSLETSMAHEYTPSLPESVDATRSQPSTHEEVFHSEPHEHSTTDVSFELQDEGAKPHLVVTDSVSFDNASSSHQQTTEVPQFAPEVGEGVFGINHPSEQEPPAPSYNGVVIAASDVQDPIDGTVEQPIAHEHSTEHDSVEATVENQERQDGDDPPYPVVMVFQSDGQDQPWNLFTHDDGAAETTATMSGQPLLLQDRIDLFHRPLSDFFGHLRELDFIQRDPDFHRGELLMNAYDMELSITEDNIFARQIAFRDLVILHKGFPLSGPLSIRISFNLKSFRTRYTLLSAQAAGVQEADEINNEDQEAHEADNLTEEGTDHDHQEAHEVADAPANEPEVNDTSTDAQLHDNAAVEDYPQGDERPDPEVAQGTAQAAALLTQDDPSYHQVGNTTDAGALEGEDEYEDTAAALTEGSGKAETTHPTNPDAERVHNTTDEPEPEEQATEYEDHENDYEDDDERFGEDLPAEDGGDDVVTGHDGDTREQEIWENAADDLVPTFTPAALKAGIEHGAVKPASKLDNTAGVGGGHESADNGKNDNNDFSEGGDNQPEHKHEGEEYADNDDDLEASTEELQAWEVGDHPDTSYDKATDATAEDEPYAEENEEETEGYGKEHQGGYSDEEEEVEEYDEGEGEAANSDVADNEDNRESGEADREVASVESSVTLSSGNSKRGYDELEDDNPPELNRVSGSPSGSKRARVD